MRYFLSGVLPLSYLTACLVTAQNQAVESRAEIEKENVEMSLQLGSAGGAYFLADPGELWVDVSKQDLNARGRRTHLRAILFGPDRAVLAEEVIADDGKPKDSGRGPIQTVRLSTQVPRKGIYGVNITVTEDRYGDDAVWGVTSNCPNVSIETSRGHKDAWHEEPIVLRNDSVPGDICFLPVARDLAIDVAGLPADSAPLTLMDATGKVLATLPASDKRTASCRIPANIPRENTPWRLHLPTYCGIVRIDGLNRWKADDPYRDLGLWSPTQESWFPFPENRWLLTPYSKLVYGRPGGTGRIHFKLHNNALVQRDVDLGLEFPGKAWSVSLGPKHVTLPPRQETTVALNYQIPEDGSEHVCHIRATPRDGSGYTTYSTVTVRTGEAPAANALSMPLSLKPYEHENEQFGYDPAYPTDGQVYFGMQNRPFVATNSGIHHRREDGWQRFSTSAFPGASDAAPARLRCSKVAFDAANNVYGLYTVDSKPSLIYSLDDAATFSSVQFAGSGTFDIEQFSGHNVPNSPPPIVRFTRTKKDPKVFWRSLNDFELFLPMLSDTGITLGEPLLVSRKCIGISAHSGIPSSVVSRGTKVHLAWGEATEPEAKAPGVPTFVATYDRETGKLGEPVLVGYGPPANDVHNSPCITMDSKGFLHVLIGTHGRTFKYARSLTPNDAYGGWTETEDVGERLSQTYVGLICDKNDTLHLVFRLWRPAGDRFPAGSYATLAHMQKRPGEPWSKPKYLVLAPFSEYSIFYHRLTIDQLGRLFLSYDYWSTFWFYRTDHRGNRRALIMSPDGGDTWKLVDDKDFADVGN